MFGVFHGVKYDHYLPTKQKNKQKLLKNAEQHAQLRGG